MEKKERMAMLYKMLETADEQIKIYANKIAFLEHECMKLREQIHELQSQVFGGKVK
jgi:uncharacterized protein (UPF0335 family)